MKIKIVLLILVFQISNLISSQESCYNLDFEAGTFVGWEGGTGRCCPSKINNFGIINGRHTIMTGKGVDINTCEKISVVAPRGLFSARLGNALGGKQVETLSYTLNVTEENALFMYKYAVVLQDPGHNPGDQPYFRVNVYNEKKELIDPVCGSYNVIATSNLPGFEKCDEFKVVYKDWTTVGLNLSSYLGQNIIVEFETGDCAFGEHFGYAYVDAYCSSLKIDSLYCSGANGANLSAPSGFSYLWETGETTQSININNPIDGTKYTCELTSVTGCKVNISTVLKLQDPLINFEIANTCDKQEVAFKNSTLFNDNTLNSFHWDFGDGTTSTEENPKHIFSSIGNYNVTFSFSNTLGCKYSTAHSVKINSTPEPHLVDGSICLDAQGNLVNGFFLDTGLSNKDYEYKWFLNGILINDATKKNYTAIEKGNYSVLVTDTQTACFNQASAIVQSLQMASDFIPKVSEPFADNSFVNVEVIGGTGPFLFQLDDNQFQDSNTFRQLSSGEHSITVKNNVNCTLISKQITIMGYPKFFTPNNDGYNDYWNIPNYKNFFQAQISIFDRYGKLVKEISPIDLGWDGYYNGNLMPATDYWFNLKYKEKMINGDLESKSFRSHFSLKR
jgi:gliding motility-associated-like protein